VEVIIYSLITVISDHCITVNTVKIQKWIQQVVAYVYLPNMYVWLEKLYACFWRA